MKAYNHLEKKLISSFGDWEAEDSPWVRSALTWDICSATGWDVGQPIEENDHFRMMIHRLDFHSRHHDMLQRVSNLVSRMESPIEKMFIIALHAVAVIEESLNVDYILSSCDDTPFVGSQGSRLQIVPQFQINGFRVDFKLRHESIEPDYENETTRNGITLPGWKKFQKEVLVECDGHDFHERTKEQARRDRQRDRKLQSAGYRVLRFTGSEVWADPAKCAREALGFLLPDGERLQAEATAINADAETPA